MAWGGERPGRGFSQWCPTGACSGWGHRHYSTFDGTTYSFLGNCTYILVREIRPRYGNLSILLHSHYCRATVSGTSCPRALQVLYEAMEIILTTTTGTSGTEESLVSSKGYGAGVEKPGEQTPRRETKLRACSRQSPEQPLLCWPALVMGPWHTQVLFDGVQVSGGFSKNGVSVSVTVATSMRVDIPAISMSVAFTRSTFQVWLPYSHFSHNTEGQCGECPLPWAPRQGCCGPRLPGFLSDLPTLQAPAPTARVTTAACRVALWPPPAGTWPHPGRCPTAAERTAGHHPARPRVPAPGPQLPAFPQLPPPPCARQDHSVSCC